MVTKTGFCESIGASADLLDHQGFSSNATLKRFTDLTLCHTLTDLKLFILMCLSMFGLWKKLKWSVFHTHGSLHVINGLWCFPLVTLAMQNHTERLLSFPLAQHTWQTSLLLIQTLQEYTVHVYTYLFHIVLIKAPLGFKVSLHIKWIHI